MAITKLTQTMIENATTFGLSILSAANQAAAQTILNILSPVVGTFTPAITVNDSATGVVHTTQVGTYFKFGRLVFCAGFVILSNKGASAGIVRLVGLPFVPSNVQQFYPLTVSNSANISGAGPMSGLISATTTKVVLYWNGATGSNLLLETNITNTTDLRFYSIYITD